MTNTYLSCIKLVFILKNPAKIELSTKIKDYVIKNVTLYLKFH